MRRVLVPAAAGLVAVAAVVLAVGMLTGGSAPAERAATLVPASALAYVHLSTDPQRDEDTGLLQRLSSFPGVRAAQERLSRLIGQDFDLARDVRPWLGDEVAFALLDTGASRADSLLLLAVRDRPKAETFLRSAGGARGTNTYRGVPIQRFAAVSVAFTSGFMAVGQDSAVRAAIDRSQGRGAALSASVAYERATAGRPDERVLDVVIPASGVERVLAPAPGALGALGGLLSHDRLVAVGASLVGEEDGLRVEVRQARSGGAAREFAPDLVQEVPRDAAAYLGSAGVEAFAAVVPPSAREALGGVLDEALASASLDVQRDLVDPLAGEVALSVTPGLPVPTVTLVARTRDAARTREAMARLQQPIAERLAPPATRGTPARVFEERDLGGVEAFSLGVATGFELTYAVTDGMLIVSSQSNGVGHVLADRAGLDESEPFDRALDDLPDRAQAVLFVDLGQLLALVEQAGSTGDPTFDALRADLRRVRTVSAVVTREENDSTAELFLEIP